MFFWSYLTSILLTMAGFFLIFLVLIQRGRGGGLAGAFGGMGGQSAFGTKAGDVFTKITVGTFVVWVILAAVTGFAMRGDAGSRFKAAESPGPAVPTAGPLSEGTGEPTGTEGSQDGSTTRDNPFDLGGDTAGQSPTDDTPVDAGGSGGEQPDGPGDGNSQQDPPDSSTPAEP